MAKQKLIFLSLAVVMFAAAAGWRLSSQSSKDNGPGAQTTKFNKRQYSTTDPSSLWVIVNKNRPLSNVQYVPSDLMVPNVKLRLDPAAEQMQISQKMYQSLKDLFAAGKVAGFEFELGSGYRSYSLQKQFYDEYVRTMGEAEANRTSAHPGASEHQTGLAFDIEASGQKCHLDKCLADLPDGKWLAAHAHEYGFITRYPLGKEGITGYDFEPWHLRFVGKDLASQLHAKNKTMEEFFGIN